MPAKTKLPIKANTENIFPSPQSSALLYEAYAHNPTHPSQTAPPNNRTNPNSIVPIIDDVSEEAAKPNKNVFDTIIVITVAAIEMIVPNTLFTVVVFLRKLHIIKITEERITKIHAIVITVPIASAA